MAIQQRMWTIMQGILNMAKEKKCLEFLRTWMWCRLEVVGIQILIHQQLKMENSMRVVRVMTKGQRWLAIMD